jgi:hypothetical protein
MSSWVVPSMVVIGLILAPARSEAAESEKGQHFHLTMPHTPEQCLAALDHMAAKDKRLFERTDWGCRYGDHTGYVTVAAENEQAALAMVPEAERANVKAQKVGKFTAKDLAEIHKKRAAQK